MIEARSTRNRPQTGDDKDRRRSPRPGVRFAALGVGLLALGGALAFATAEALPRPLELAGLLRESGPAGALLSFFAFAVLQPWGLPGSLFIVPASLVWPWWIAFALSWAGATVAALVAFGFARWLGHDWAHRRLPPTLRAYDEGLADGGLATVVLLRLLFVCAPPASWLLGVSQLRPGAFLLGTAVGLVPGIALITWVGNRGLVAYQESSMVSVWLALAGLAAFIGLRRWLGRVP